MEWEGWRDRRDSRKYIGGVEIQKERKAQVRTSRATALVCVSLVPEVDAAVGNAGAHGAGSWGLFAQGKSEATFSKCRARDHLGLLGRRGVLGRELGS